jgi:mono/diheme cytochrome c family protein
MMLRSALILVLATTACLTASASSSKQRDSGAAIFAQTGCQHCHTIEHNGGTKGPDLSGVGLRLSAAQIKKQILGGGRQMPSFQEMLKKSEVDDLVAYLRSCRDKDEK